MYEVGQVVANKYRLERILGQGGMGVVVKATHIHLGQAVAIKFLLPEVVENPEVVERFVREAQAAVRLKGEHVARVIDIGTLDNAAPYIVLEYLEGTDLAEFSRDQLSIGLISDLLIQACEALAEAHANGIIHRDVKPANLFVTRRPNGSLLLKILDFGISKSAIGSAEHATQNQAVMGTPAYMSPEQMRSSRDVDARSDIWALGVVLYELLEGRLPFVAATFSAMCIEVVVEATPPLTVALPPGLADIVYRCLEKERSRRYSTTAELARALAPYAQSPAQAAAAVERTSRMPPPSLLDDPSSSHATVFDQNAALGKPRPSIDPPPLPPTPTTLSAAVGTMVLPASALPQPGKRRRWPAAVAAATVALACVGVLLVVRGSSQDVPNSPRIAVRLPEQIPVESIRVDAGVDAAEPIASAPADATASPPADAITVSPVSVDAPPTVLQKRPPPNQNPRPPKPNPNPNPHPQDPPSGGYDPLNQRGS